MVYYQLLQIISAVQKENSEFRKKKNCDNVVANFTGIEFFLTPNLSFSHICFLVSMVLLIHMNQVSHLVKLHSTTMHVTLRMINTKRAHINTFIPILFLFTDVHLTVRDLLPKSTYFRFNAYMSEDFLLDEVNPEKWQKMLRDTDLYCRKNEQKFNKAAATLNFTRGIPQRAKDWVNHKRITGGHYFPTNQTRW